MKFITPSYYQLFRCIADKCTDNCCIGWEIGIDPDTAQLYRSVDSDFGKRLQENITADDTFILQNERCPFLNSKNLCDIIIHCGENHLCQICRDHPRYFEWYGDIKEGGIGLSCEEGARLILTTDHVDLCETQVHETQEEVDDELLAILQNARAQLFFLLDDDTLSLADKLKNTLAFAEKLQFLIDNPQFGAEDFVFAPADVSVSMDDFISLFFDFEPIDEHWTEALLHLSKDFSALTKHESQYMINLCRYFLWRYFCKGVFDGEILSKTKFAVVSALLIRLLCGEHTDLATWTEKAKLYSKEMEYSDENRELFYDYTYDKDMLSSSAILRLIDTLLR